MATVTYDLSFKTEGLSFTCRFSATTTRSGRYCAAAHIADYDGLCQLTF